MMLMPVQGQLQTAWHPLNDGCFSPESRHVWMMTKESALCQKATLIEFAFSVG